MRQRWIRLGMLPLSLLLFACGAGKPKAQGPDPCKMGEQHLKQTIGPEFGRIAARATTGIKAQFKHGCALVYTRLAEELPEEVSDDTSVLSLADHRLALMLLTEKGNPRFIKIARGRAAPGPVSIKLAARDVNGDTIPDFVVQERARVQGDTLDYQSLRIIDGSGTSGRIMFDRPLRMKTAEGLELIPRWSLSQMDQSRYLLLQGGGQTLSFIFNPKTRRFRQVEEKKTSVKAKGKTPAPTGKGTGKTAGPNTQGIKLNKTQKQVPAPKMEQFLIDD